MDPGTQERVEQWDSRPFTGDQDGLADLAAEGFSGVVTAGDVWLFVLNGRAVGVDGGDVADLTNASGTAYVAPDPAPPLLAAMKIRGGETRAKYYTNKTPLEEVDSTLQDGSFTGYVELSEQVLSGDYYLVYYGGRRMAAAYIGNAERLLTGEEAFERAADEVGIYEVVDVDVDVVDLAEVVDDEPDVDDPEPEPDPENESDPSETDETPTPTDEGMTTPTDEVASSSAQGDPSESSDDGAPADITATEDASSEPTDDSVDARTESTDEPTIDQPEATDQPERPTTQEDTSSDAGITASFTERVVDSEGTDDEEDLDKRFKQEEQWRETRSIPSIDPDNSTVSPARSDRRVGQTNNGAESQPSPRTTRTSSTPSRSQSERSDPSTTPQSQSEPRPGASNTTNQDAADRSDERLEKLREQRDTLKAKLEDLQDERDELAQKAATLEDERDATREENRELSATVERLENRVEELEAELEAARSVDATGAATTSTTGRALSADRALDGTNLFVRYESKGKATLEKVHAGEADPEAVHTNLHLDHHTEFDSTEVAVDGTSYEEFLPTTLEFQFVDWLVDTLLYEIQDTGRTSGLADLYDAIPEIDRIEFSATISLADDDTEDVPDEVTFDVVVFDKMGRPLIVANLNDSRDPATREMLERLEETASAVKANYSELAAAIAVTSSFFQPGALEVTEQATSGGLLSRSSKLNYVNVSRKQGYHLCLVEARSGGFHMTVPEL
ncbi:DUF7527 domain-containing protein [Natrialbaceae archaeon A-gly3]